MHTHPLSHKPALMYPWDKRTLFIGRLPGPVQAAYGAATLMVSLGNPITISNAGSTISCCSALMPAGMPMVINAGSEIIALLHLDVLGDDFKRFSGCFQHEGRGHPIQHTLLDEMDYRTLLTHLLQQPSDSTVTFHLIDNLLEYSFVAAGSASTIDCQVQDTVDHIKHHFQDNISVNTLAQRVQLSTPSLIRRFKQQAGLPIRRFRLWHRIYRSMIFISEGQNLTEAAFSAGFSDSSHYTHSLQSMWGVSPSCLFAREIRAEIVPPVE